MSIENTIEILDGLIPEDTKIPEWKPIVNQAKLPDPPEFPLEALPPVLKNLAEEVSVSIKVPPALAAAEILAMVGLAIGRNVYYILKKGVTGRANLYMLIFAARGERKSAVDHLLRQPFDVWLTEKLKEYNNRIEQADLIAKRREFLVTRLVKAKDFSSPESDQLRDEIQLLANQLDELPPHPNIFTNNITQEALLQKLSRCGGTVAVFADDGRAPLKMILGKRYSKDGDAQDDVFLDCFDGSKTLSYDRSGRSIVPISRPCIGLMLMLQPDMLIQLAGQEEIFDSGFASRCLFCFPESWVGKRHDDGSLKRDIDDLEVSDGVIKAYSELIHRFMNQSYDQEEPCYIGIAKAAKEFWKQHYREVESESDVGGRYYDTLSVAIRYPSQTLRLALLISQVNGHERIELEDIQNAHTLMRYFIVNAERCHFYMKEMALPDDARKIIRHWLRSGLPCHTARDIYRATGITAGELAEMIALLAKRNYCRIVKADGNGLIEVNPELLQSDLFY